MRIWRSTPIASGGFIDCAADGGDDGRVLVTGRDVDDDAFMLDMSTAEADTLRSHLTEAIAEAAARATP